MSRKLAVSAPLVATLVTAISLVSGGPKQAGNASRPTLQWTLVSVDYHESGKVVAGKFTNARAIPEIALPDILDRTL